MASGDPKQQMPPLCGQSSQDTAGWGLSMRLGFPNGGEVASEAPWEGRWRWAALQDGGCVNVASALFFSFVLQASMGLI